MRRYLAAAAVLAVVVIGWRALRSDEGPKRAAKAGASAIDAPARAPTVKRESGDPAGETQTPEEKPRRRRPPLPPGITVVDPAPVHPIAEQSEANRKSVEEARARGAFPERLDPKIAPAPFDRAAYNRDPQAYLDIVEPGRVHQVAEEGDGVDALEADEPTDVALARGETVKLMVHGEPLSPITFTVFGGGELDNGLTSITVRAKTNGSASVRFTATPGAAPSVTIVAGSPMTSGQAHFSVRVR